MKPARMVTVSWPYTQAGDALVSDDFPELAAKVNGDMAKAVCDINLMIDRHINISTPDRRAFVSAPRVDQRYQLNCDIAIHGNDAPIPDGFKLVQIEIPLAA